MLLQRRRVAKRSTMLKPTRTVWESHLGTGVLSSGVVQTSRCKGIYSGASRAPKFHTLLDRSACCSSWGFAVQHVSTAKSTKLPV
eukprot:2219337-Amphidinium_carterae.1